MEGLRIKPLDGADGYLRWKESVLLGLHTVGVAHVLSDDPPPSPARGGDGAHQAANNKWARDDALCRGHILAALSDNLLPVYVRHATGRALWQAVARTYEQDVYYWRLRFEELEFGEDETLLERLARAEALAIAANPTDSDNCVASAVSTKLPRDLARGAMRRMGEEDCMDLLWRYVQVEVAMDNDMLVRAAQDEKKETNSSRSNGEPGHVAKKRRWRRR